MAPVPNLALFDKTSHSPSLRSLRAESGNARLKDYCIPVNPYFPTPEMFESFREELEDILKFYPSYNEDIALQLGRIIDVDPAKVVMGNGSTELIAFIDLLLIKASLAIPIPTFSRWTDGPQSAGKRLNTFLRREEDDFALDIDGFIDFINSTHSRAAVICNPNNPTGALLSFDQVVAVLRRLRHLDVVVIDESFIDFSDETDIPSVVGEVDRFPNLIVLKSLGKNFGLHGVRAGYLVANPGLADRFRKALPYWNTNGLAEMLVRSLGNHMDSYERGRRQVVQDRIHLQMALTQIPGLRVYPSQANFVYLRIPQGVDGVSLRNHLLLEHGMLVRECGNKAGSSSEYFRIAARPRAENELLVSALRASLSSSR